MIFFLQFVDFTNRPTVLPERGHDSIGSSKCDEKRAHALNVIYIEVSMASLLSV